MDKLIANFTQQLSESLAIGNEVSAPSQTQIDNVLCCGLGGSGIGGKITKLLNRDYLSIPVDTCNDYNIPSFVNEKTLVIAASYSGNTEETLMALEACITKGATIAVITSGGALLEMAKENKWLHYVIPGGEQPRAMLAYSLVEHFYILKAFNLINYDFIGQIEEAITLLDANEDKIQAEGKTVANACLGKIPAIYADPTMEGIAMRFRQQLNENSKMLAWNAVIPEMNHNELVGWTGGGKDVAVIKLSNQAEFYRNTKRWEFSQSVIAKNAASVTEVHAQGSNILTQALYLIHLTDWASYYLAELKGIDATEVDAIMSLKAKLSELK